MANDITHLMTSDKRYGLYFLADVIMACNRRLYVHFSLFLKASMHIYKNLDSIPSPFLFSNNTCGYVKSKAILRNKFGVWKLMICSLLYNFKLKQALICKKNKKKWKEAGMCQYRHV